MGDVGAGIPAGMEMMDGLAINAAEDFVHAGYPRDAAALIIIELDGPEVEVNALIDRVAGIMNGWGVVYQNQYIRRRTQFILGWAQICISCGGADFA